MMCAVLKHYMPMLGGDFHDTIPPPGPVVVPSIPHFVAANLVIGPWGALTGKSQPDVISAATGITLLRTTDIGPLVPHISAPHYLLPVLLLGSASKSEFGATSVMTANGPVAVCVASVVNFNLNCHGTPVPPLPTGVVIGMTTHFTGFTLGDFLAGVLCMVMDSAVQYGLNRIMGSDRATRVLNWVQGPIVRAICPGARSMTTALFAHGMNPTAVNSLANAVPMLAGLLVGGPIGWDIATIPTGNDPTTPMGAATNAVTEYLNDPAVHEFANGEPEPVGDFGSPTEGGGGAGDGGGGDGTMMA
ncbi:MAG: hypothetical protein H0W78_03580 [Planctomycetes bacterium]|jgi:hypothetical protein|nr:hypothetical protein [Planctomycetota bacterium]